MQNNLMTQTEVAQAWGYKSVHEQLRAFLATNAQPVHTVKIGRQGVRLYDRATILRLRDKYADYINVANSKRNDIAREMGLQRRLQLKANGFAAPGVSASVANVLQKLTDRVSAAEERLAKLERDLGVNG